jgi:lysyl-tRNA synthetase class 2
MTSTPSVGSSWAPVSTWSAIKGRAEMLRRLRAFFDARGALEVETPVLSQAATTDPALASLQTRLADTSTNRFFLHTSPEFPMKRLLAAGSGPIYQVCKVFRDAERGRLHHPEFSLLEWYRPGWGLEQLMEEVADLVRSLLDRPELPVEQLRYRDLFDQRLGIDPWKATAVDLQRLAQGRRLPGADDLELDRDGWLDLLLTHCLEPDLGRGRMSFLRDYPPSQAALARISGNPPVAERFELYLDGVEIANGFFELTDAVEHRERFLADQRKRAGLGLPHVPIDEHLLAALAAGLPACSGVAMGLDRLLMQAIGVDRIDAVLAFPIERA